MNEIVPSYIHRFPLVAHLQPKYWWFFLVELGRKAYINFVYLRGYRSDDGFRWKVAVGIYLLLEAFAQQLLKPRVYKKARDTLVESAAKLFLILVLLLAICSDALEGGSGLREGGGVRPEPMACAALADEATCGAAVAFCAWDGARCGVDAGDQAGFDEELLSLSLPHSRLYGESSYYRM